MPDAADAFTVNFPSVTTATEAVMAATKLIDQITDQLEGDAERSLSFWEDTARDMYYVSKKKWDTAINEMTMVLGMSGQVLNDINDNYKGTESKNSMLWEK
jgi:early secretory antigenic target protein ESAT-6